MYYLLVQDYAYSFTLIGPFDTYEKAEEYSKHEDCKHCEVLKPMPPIIEV